MFKKQDPLIKSKPGFSVFIVLIVMVPLVILCVNAWRRSLMLVEISIAKEQYERHRINTEGLLNMTLAIYRKNSDSILKGLVEDKITAFFAAPWPTGSSYNGCVTMEKIKDDDVIIRARLVKGGKILCRTSCGVVNFKGDKTSRLQIVGWRTWAGQK